MTQNLTELFESMTSLIVKYHDFLGMLYPLPGEMAKYFEPDASRPTRETLLSWKERLHYIDQKHGELALAFESLRQSLGLPNQGNA